jgi:HPt (histidine-containing phosphotransfer) domain-containing protein
MHMPEMDGLELSRTIREIEAAEPARGRTPIVALTANAMPGEDQRCRAAGMDDFLAKPASLARLGQVIAAHMPADAVGTKHAASARAPRAEPGDAPVSLDRLATILGDDDPDLALDVLGEFVAKLPPTLDALDGALARGEASEIAAAAHAAKGAAASVGAASLESACMRIEVAARAGDIAGAAALGVQVHEAFARIRAYLDQRRPETVR